MANDEPQRVAAVSDLLTVGSSWSKKAYGQENVVRGCQLRENADPTRQESAPVAMQASVPVALAFMKYEEKIAARFLKAVFNKQPIYEPLGSSTPPDFSIDGTAFEVRRLNENFTHTDGKTEGIEELSYRLNRAVFGELAKIPFSPTVGSFFIGMTYARPLPASPGKIARALAEKARLYYRQGSRKRHMLITNGVTAQIIPASTPGGKAFLPGFETDDQSGGLVGEIYCDNIRFALEEKVRKTKPFTEKFNRWVLILVDSISPGIEWTSEMAGWTPDLQHFDAIVVVNPNCTIAWLWPPNSSLRAAGWRRRGWRRR